MVALRPLTDANREAAEALRVASEQARFVSDVAASLREAAEHPGAHAEPFVVYDGETPVGFVMIADEVEGPDYVPQYLWKLLIDERLQRQGFGTATLDLVVELFRARPGAEVLTTSAGQGDGQPAPVLRAVRLRAHGRDARRRGRAPAPGCADAAGGGVSSRGRPSGRPPRVRS